MSTRRMLFTESPHRTFEVSGLGACAACEGTPDSLGFLGDFTTTTDASTGITTTDYKASGIDPAMGSKLVFEGLSDLFTGRLEKESARQSAERLAKIQAGNDLVQAQQRALATERWTAVAPWALMGISVIGVGIILLKVSKK